MKKISYSFLIFFACTVSLFAQNTISLVGRAAYSGIPIHDVNRYVDSVTQKPYALLCASTSGMRIIDISNPASPAQTGTISGSGVNVVDVGVYRHYAYTVSENITNTTGKIIDLANPAAPVLVGTFPGSHTVYVTENGFMYLATPGIRIFDLRADPAAPQLVYSDNSCTGHDISIIGNRLYFFSDNCGTKIYDITQPDTLQLLGTVPTPGVFNHSGYPSANGNYLFLCDELSAPNENDIFVWDISNLAAPVLVDSFADANAYVHNLYVRGNYAYVSYYRAGFRVFDVSVPTNISLVAEYDTDSTLTGPGYEGNYGLYVFSPDGNILASDENKGLYIFRFSGLSSGINATNIEETNFSIYPNPTTDEVEIESKTDKFNLWVTNIYGASLFEKKCNSSKINISMEQFPKGIYFFNIKTNQNFITKKIIKQ